MRIFHVDSGLLSLLIDFVDPLETDWSSLDTFSTSRTFLKVEWHQWKAIIWTIISPSTKHSRACECHRGMSVPDILPPYLVSSTNYLVKKRNPGGSESPTSFSKLGYLGNLILTCMYTTTKTSINRSGWSISR